MATLTRRGTGITQTGWTNPTNAYDAGTATFASWASTVANQTNTIYITGYDFLGAGLPSTAGLNSVSFTVKQYVSAANRMNAPAVRAYVGATPLGTTTTLTNATQTTNVQTVTITGVTISDLNDASFQVEFVATHYNGTQSGTQFLDYIDVVVDYSPLAAPTSRTLAAASETATSVLLTWNADTAAYPSPTYTIERSTDGSSFTSIATGVTGTTYSATDLTTNTLYYFRIIGTNSQGSATSNTATATPVAWTLENTLEGGTDETSIPASPSLSGPDAFNLFYSNTAAVYDTALAKSGTVSMRTQHTTGTSGSSMAGWTFTTATRLPFYTRFYFYTSSLPAAQTTIVRIGNSADTSIASLRLNTAGTLSVGGGTLATTTATISTSTWIRIELAVTSTGMTLRLYNSPESSTATEEITQTATYAAVGTIRYGVNAVTNAGPYWWDSLKTGESWLGSDSVQNATSTPAVISVTATPLAPTETAGATSLPAVISTTATPLTPTETATGTAAVSVINTTATPLTPTETATSTITTSVISATATPLAPTLSAGASVISAVINAAATLLDPTETADSSATPNVLAATATPINPSATKKEFEGSWGVDACIA